MQNIQKQIRRNWLIIIFIVIIGVISTSAYVAFEGFKSAEVYGDEFSQFMDEEMRGIVKEEVENRVQEINYELSKLQENENQLIRGKVHNIAHLLVEAQDEINTDSVAFRDYFDTLVSADSDYLYFVIRGDGTLIRSGTDSRQEGQNIIDNQDSKGKYYIREMLTAKDNPEGLYVTYEWPKVTGGEPKQKTSYVYYLKEYDIVLGLGSYREDIEAKLQEAVYSRLQAYYQGRERYVFIVQYDGIAKVFADPSMIDKSTTNIRTINDVALHELFLKKVQTEGSGYVHYNYYKRNLEEVSEKTTFVMALPDWQAYIGMGYYHDALNEIIQIHADKYFAQSTREVLAILLSLVLTTSLVFLFIRRGMRFQNDYMKQEDIIFEQLFHLSSEGIIIVSEKGEIIYSNRMIHHYMGSELASYFYGDRLQLDMLQEDVYKIENELRKTYYVEYKSEPFNYHHKNCQIYFIKDVTSQIIKANELERQAYFDELTGLPNRRQLVNDFEDFCYVNDIESRLIYGMLDLDHFKYVNDTYGHDKGDQVLKLLAETFEKRLRDYDKIYRYGGEEFVVSLRHTNLADARDLLERIKSEFKHQLKERLDLTLSFSAGLATVDDHRIPSALSNHLKKADELLYQAKSSGRDKILF